MDYNQTIEFLFNQFPAYQNNGASAYKPGLERIESLCQLKNNPQNNFKSIHVAGTNGKGSVSSMLCSVLMEAGYKVGLFTSPHLVDFRERIRVNGKVIPSSFVVDFIEELKVKSKSINPSFFEYTTLMAFDYFSKEQVDIAIIETGLGGRLDCSNVILPEISVITNIGLDHVAFLGDNIAAIAAEKAGIIKKERPVVIGRFQDKADPVFKEKAAKENARLTYSEEVNFESDLKGIYQKENIHTCSKTIEILNQLGWSISDLQLETGLKNVLKNSNLRGRWEILESSPVKVITDVGHNEDGIANIVEQLNNEFYRNLHIVWGTLEDKDINSLLALLPKKAIYYFAEPKNNRALNVNELQSKASKIGLVGQPYSSVKSALEDAKRLAKKDDLIFVGGSTFVVAEVLQ